MMVIMAKIDSKKKGFTLVEILIVLGIVAMLSVLAVNGYMSYRKSTLLDFAADNLIAQINEMKSKTRHGGGDSVKFEEIKAELIGGVEDGGVAGVSDSGSQCYGIYFENSEDGFVAKSFARPFVNQKVWEPVGQKWNYLGCGDFVPGDGDILLEKDSQVNIIEIDEGSVIGSFMVRFLPPNGEVEMLKDGQFFVGDSVKIKMQYGPTADLQYQREIILDLTN